jgi:hypothetical protein
MSGGNVNQNRYVTRIIEQHKGLEKDSAVQAALTSLQQQINVLQAIVAAAGTVTTTQGQTNLGFDQIRPTVIQMINQAGTELYNADVVVQDLTSDNGVKTTAIAYSKAIGTVASDAHGSTVGTSFIFVSAAAEIGSYVAIAVNGKAGCRVKTTSPREGINVGDYLCPDDTARYARKARPDEPGVFAIALQDVNSGIDDEIIDVLIFPKADYDNRIDGQPFVLKVTYDDDGSVTGFSGFITKEEYFRDATLSTRIKTESYMYSSDGNLISMIISMFDAGGTGSYTIQQAISYSADMLDQIIQEVAG